MQLLLDAGADPTIPSLWCSPVRQALDNDHHDIAALLEHAIAEPERIRECVTAMGKDDKLGEDLAWKIATYLIPEWATKKGPHA